MRYTVFAVIHSSIVILQFKNDCRAIRKRDNNLQAGSGRTMTSVGMIGIGEIGSRMVKRLLAQGYEVSVFDIDADKTASILGAYPCASPAELASRSTVIITCVTNSQAVEKALLGDDGVITTVRPHSIVIEMTTSTPTTTRQVAAKLEPKGVQVIDAPVSRGVPAAEDGTLSIMVGGNEHVLNTCLPILEVLGTDIIHVGELGSGHVVKAVNMMMLGANLIAAAEIIALGVKAGLSRQTILDVMNVSSGESFMTSNHYPKYVMSERFDSKFSLELMLKDIRVGTQIAHEIGVPALMASRVEELYVAASKDGLGTKDNMTIVPWLETLMSVQESYRG